MTARSMTATETILETLMAIKTIKMKEKGKEMAKVTALMEMEASRSDSPDCSEVSEEH